MLSLPEAASDKINEGHGLGALQDPSEICGSMGLMVSVNRGVVWRKTWGVFESVKRVVRGQGRCDCQPLPAHGPTPGTTNPRIRGEISALLAAGAATLPLRAGVLINETRCGWG